MAASPGHVAAACSDGEVRLFATANLELVGVLPPPPQLARAAAAVACAFSAGGAQLAASYRGTSGGSLTASWDISDLQQPAMLADTLRPCHRFCCCPRPACVGMQRLRVGQGASAAERCTSMPAHLDQLLPSPAILSLQRGHHRRCLHPHRLRRLAGGHLQVRCLLLCVPWPGSLHGTWCTCREPGQGTLACTLPSQPTHPCRPLPPPPFAPQPGRQRAAVGGGCRRWH